MPEVLHKVTEFILTTGFIPAVEQFFNTRHHVIQDMRQLLQRFHMELHIVAIPTTEKLELGVGLFIALMLLQFVPLFYAIIRDRG